MGLDEEFRRLKGMGYSELGRLWGDVKDDVQKIVNMPQRIPGVPRMIRLRVYLRLAGRMFLILSALVIASLVVRAWKPALGELLGGQLWFLLLVIVGVMATINGEVMVDFLIRRRVVRYEQETEAQYAGAVAELKRATQAVIRQLVREVKQGQRDPGLFPFDLFFDDYEGIEVVEVRTPRAMPFFKRQFQVYTAIPKID